MKHRVPAKATPEMVMKWNKLVKAVMVAADFGLTPTRRQRAMASKTNGKRVRPTRQALTAANVRAAAAENREESLKQQLAAIDHELGKVRGLLAVELDRARELEHTVKMQRESLTYHRRPTASFNLPGVSIAITGAPEPTRHFTTEAPVAGYANESAPMAESARG